jgi:hypothetical protein
MTSSDRSSEETAGIHNNTSTKELGIRRVGFVPTAGSSRLSATLPWGGTELLSGFSNRILVEAHAGTTRPHRKNRERLAAIVRGLGLI